MLLAAAPWWADRPSLRLLAEIYAYVALASLWNLLAGYAGLVSVGQQAYVGLGAYVLFALAMLAGVHPLVAIPIAGLAAAIVSVPVAALIFRLRGHYFAIGTWVVAEVFRLLASQVSALDGGSGTSLPAAIVLSIAATRQMREFVIYWIALAMAVAVLGGIVLLLRSRYGLALTAIRDSELGARSNGVDVARIKYVVYVAVAFGTAMVGALIFLQKIRISPDTAFSVNDWTAFVIFITVIGGIGRIEGPIIGTVVFFLLRQTLADLGAIYLLILGRGRDRGHAQGAEGHLGPDRRSLRLAGVPAGAPAGDRKTAGRCIQGIARGLWAELPGRARPSKVVCVREAQFARRFGRMMPMRSSLLGVLFAAGAAALPLTAHAQSYPTRAVKIIVPTTAGGSYDIVGRLLADQLSKRMGQPFVIENRPGAGSVVGTQAAAVAPADGYTW